MKKCGCRCIKCKNAIFNSNSFVSNDGFEDTHHTCDTCGTHFNHLDGEVYSTCSFCNYELKKGANF